MMSNTPVNDYTTAFLTIIAWPPDMEPQDAAKLMADAVGLDVPTTLLWARQEPPAILARLPKPLAHTAAQTIVTRGGDGFAPSLADLAALGPTHKIKDLRLQPAGIQIEPWRGTPEVIDPQSIDIIVRAHLSATTVPPRPSDLYPGLVTAAGFLAGSVFGFGYGGAFGMAVGIYAQRNMADWAAIDKRFVASHKLDLHVRRQGQPPAVFQIDGDKFGFQILGQQRGPSDHVNIDRLCELFTTLNPQIVVDPYFRLWKPPAGHTQLRLPMKQVNQDDPAFAFYSRWTARLYRHILNGGIC